MTHHYDDEALFQYVAGTSPIREEIEAHITSCRTCAVEIGSHRDVVDALKAAEVWDDGVDRETLPEKPLAVTFAQRLAAEDEQAKELCDQILTGPPAWWATRLRKSANARTAGMVRQLLERMRGIVQGSPVNALQVTTLAIEVANDLEIAAYPSDFVVTLRGQTLRDHAFVLSFVGRMPEALETADRARRLLEQIPLPEYELARLDHVCALILNGLDRFPEAIELAHRSAETFCRFGDAPQYAKARMTKAGILFESGAVAEALEVWRTVENDPALDSLTRIGMIHNIALCRRHLGHIAEAIECFGRCVAEYEMMGMDTERTRSRWSLGTTLVVAGRSREAIPVLRQAWREYESLEMISDAGLVALELAEALLLVGEPGQVPAICRELVNRFSAAGMTSRAITALSFLREAVAIGQAKPSLIREVHAFLRELHVERPRLHAPSPAGAFED